VGLTKRILVTGGAGYIGSHTIVELLALNNIDVVSVDNFINSEQRVYDRIEDISGRKFENHQVDLTDAKATEELFASSGPFDGVIHFAALKSVPESVENPQLYRDNNNKSLEHVLLSMKNQHVNNLIFSSSCSVYGSIRELPVVEETPFGKPESPYAETKQEGERMIRVACEANEKFQAISLRYFNPVGAHPSGKLGELQRRGLTNLVPIITSAAAGRLEELVISGDDYDTKDGTCVRDYVHVCDIARAHVLAMDYLLKSGKQLHYEVFNLGTGKGVSVMEMVKAFEKANKIKLPYRVGERRKGDVPAIYADYSKAKKVLGWVPEFSLEDMMRSAWTWEQHRD
jgi:UDP-glucose 4-epimerase